MKKNIVISISGGRSSALMARHIQIDKKYLDYKKLYVFANTGQERVETINFLKNIIKHWKIDLKIVEAIGNKKLGKGITYKIVNFDNLSMNSEPFENIIMHKNKGCFKGLPSFRAPYCSFCLKNIPINKFANDFFGKNNYITAIGYRYEDIPKRITKEKTYNQKKYIYPLLNDFFEIIDKNYLDYYWDRQNFRLTIPSKLGNCELCWKKSDKNIIENIQFGANSINWWQKMEIKYNSTSFRNYKSINDFIKLSKVQQTSIKFN